MEGLMVSGAIQAHETSTCRAWAFFICGHGTLVALASRGAHPVAGLRSVSHAQTMRKWTGFSRRK